MVFPMDGAVMPPAEPEQPQPPLTVNVCRDGIELREQATGRLVRSYRDGEEVPQAMLDRIQGEPVMCVDRSREEDVFSVEALGRLLGGMPNRNGDVFSQDAIAGGVTRQAIQDAITVLSRQGARSDADYWAGILARRQARQDRLRAEAAAHTIGVGQASQPMRFMDAAWEVTVTRPEQEPAVHRFADPQFIGRHQVLDDPSLPGTEGVYDSSTGQRVSGSVDDPNPTTRGDEAFYGRHEVPMDPTVVIGANARDPVHSYPLPCTLCGHDAVRHAGAPCSVQGCHCPRYRTGGEDMSSLYQTLCALRNATPSTAGSTQPAQSDEAMAEMDRRILEDLRNNAPQPRSVAERIDEAVAEAGAAVVPGRAFGIRFQNSWGEEGDHARRIEVMPGAPFDQAFTDALGVPPVEQRTPYQLDQQRGWPTPASLDFTAQVEPTPPTPASPTGIAMVVTGAYELVNTEFEPVGTFVPGEGARYTFRQSHLDDMLGYVTGPECRARLSFLTESQLATTLSHLQDVIRTEVTPFVGQALTNEVQTQICNWAFELINGTVTEQRRRHESARSLHVDNPPPQFVDPSPAVNRPADRVAHVSAQAAMNQQIFNALANPHMEAEAQAAAVEHARQQVTRCRFCQHDQSSHGDDGGSVDRGCRVPGCNCSQFRVRSYDDTPRRIMPPLTPPPMEQQAADAVNEFTRNRMRENNFYRRIMPAIPVDDYDQLDRSVTNRAMARANELARAILNDNPAWGGALLDARAAASHEPENGYTGLDTVDYDLIVNRMLCIRAEQAGQSPGELWQAAGQIARREDRQEITPQERFALAPSDSLLDHFIMERQRLQRASVRRREEYQQIQQARARANELLDLIERDRLAYNSAMLELQQQGMEFYERVQHHLVIEARVRGGEWMHRNNWGYIDEEPLRAAAWAREVAQEIMARPGDPMQSGRLVEMRDEHPNRARLVEEQITLLQVQASSARHAQVVEPVAAEAAGRFLGMTVTEQERQLRAIRERNPALARRIAALVDHARHERGEEVLPRTYETVGPAVGNTAGLQRIQLENGSGFTYGMTPRLLRADFSSAADPEPQPAASTEDPMVQAREKLIRLLETPPPPLPTPVQFENIQLGSYPVNRDGAWEAAMEQILNNMGVPADVLQGTGGSTTQINFNDIRPRGEPIAASRSVDYGAGATAGDMITRVQALLLNQRTLADLQSWARQPGNLPDEARQSFLRDGLPEMFGAQLIVTENLPDGRVVIRERQDAQPMNEVNRNLTQLRRSINNIQNALNLPASPETTPATPPEEPRN